MHGKEPGWEYVTMAARRRGKAGMGAALAVVLALGACGPRMTWTKEGSTADELRGDEKACLAESDRYGFLLGWSQDPSSLSPSPSVAARQQGDIYSSCMETKGYNRAPAPPQPAGGPVPAE